MNIAVVCNSKEHFNDFISHIHSSYAGNFFAITCTKDLVDNVTRLRDFKFILLASAPYIASEELDKIAYILGFENA